MKRSFKALTQTQYDVVIVGGGVYGACIAEKLGRSGYKAALIEASDFGAATSSNSLGILHGGLRYLQHFNLKRMRRSIKSRHYFMRLAPQIIDITAFNYPLKGWSINGPLAMRIALTLNDFISRRRNENLPSNIHIPKSYVRSSDASQWFSETPKLNGVGVWHEAVVRHLERLVLEITQSASQQGVDIANYCKAERLIMHKDELTGIRIKDRLSGQRSTLSCRWVIDASGHNIGRLHAGTKKLSKTQTWARAVNAIIEGRIIGDEAIALTVPDTVQDTLHDSKKHLQNTRSLFFVPQHKQTLVGTFYDHQNNLKKGLALSEKEKIRFLKDINQCHPRLNIRLDEVSHWQSGWLPLEAQNNANDHHALELKSESQLNKHLYQGQHTTGVIEVKGVKFTTAPAVAEDVHTLLAEHIAKQSQAKKQTSNQTPPNRELEKQLYTRYGQNWHRVKALLLQDKNHLTPLHEQLRQGEIYYMCQHEMALRLSDIMLRRLTFKLEATEAITLATKISLVMQTIYHWSDARREREIEHFTATLG